MTEHDRITLRIDFGRTRLRGDEVARLRNGSVVALSSSTAEPVELHAGGRLVAYGEPVVVEGRLAVRVLQLAGSQEENLRRACGALAAEGTV
jgi:flagellar motor switch protein FliN/FliY